MKSYVHLYLGEGSTLIAADSPLPGTTTGYNGGTYDAAEPKTDWDAYQDYGHNHWRNSLIWADGVHDIAITGPGLIWGRGLSSGTEGHSKLGAQFKAEQPGVGNKSIAMKNCHNVLLRDFSVLKGGHDSILTTGVDKSHDRQPEIRRGAGSARYRLLPKRQDIELYSELSLGRRDLPEVQLRSWVSAPYGKL